MIFLFSLRHIASERFCIDGQAVPPIKGQAINGGGAHLFGKVFLPYCDRTSADPWRFITELLTVLFNSKKNCAIWQFGWFLGSPPGMQLVALHVPSLNTMRPSLETPEYIDEQEMGLRTKKTRSHMERTGEAASFLHSRAFSHPFPHAPLDLPECVSKNV